ncbi:MAG: head-tail connector protein [Bacteroidota bacterium]
METFVKKGELVASPEIMSLTLAKANSNIEHDDSDDLLQLLLDGAMSEAESYTGISIKKRNVTIGFSEWAKKLVLPYHPVNEITNVSYIDANGESQDLETTDYKLYSYDNGLTERVLIMFTDFPALEEDNPFPISVEAVMGYDEVPSDIKQAILLIFSHNELYREDAPIKLDRSSRAKLRPYRVDR